MKNAVTQIQKLRSSHKQKGIQRRERDKETVREKTNAQQAKRQNE